MANRDAKKIERTLKDFSLGAMSGGGGTVVVTELPEIGDPHTIYELHQQVGPTYNWVAEINNLINEGSFSPTQNGAYLLVVETYDDMLAKVNEDAHLQEDTSVIVYLRAEDRMFVNVVDVESGNIVRMEFQKNSAYSFEIDGAHLYVLKSIRVDWGTPEHPLEDPMYYGTLYNGTEFLLDQYSGNDKAFILHQVIFDEMVDFNATGYAIHQVSTLPTAEEAVANYLDDLIISDGAVNVEIDNQLKYNSTYAGSYRWDSELQNFVAITEEITEEPVIYTGELEWENYEESIYTEIPYQDIFNGNNSEWAFKPEQGGEKVSYWIYSNNVWTNTEDIGKQIVSPFIKEGTKIIVDLRKEVLQIGNESGNTSTYMFMRYSNNNLEEHYQTFNVWVNYYNDYISIKLNPNEAQNQLIATISAQEDWYWKLEQPIVVYEGDVSGLSDTSSIQNQLPEQIVFTLNKNDFVDSIGGHYLDGNHVIGCVDGTNYLDIVKVEL